MKLRGVGGKQWALPAAAVALVVLSGCGEITPGTASVVNGTRITNDQVNDLAKAQCVAADLAAESGQSTSMAISRVKQQSLGLLLDTELSKQYAEDEGLEPQKSMSDGFYSQLEPGITPLPGKTRTEIEKVFGDWAVGRAILVEAGSKSTGEEPTFTNIEKLMNAGLQARDGWLKTADITTDPRYAPTEQGFPGGGDSSVSQAGSAFAKGATAAEPDPNWVSGLPANQKCG
ncbi:MAG: hypothetical protein ABWX73_07550 [Marmoricola sp.]